MNEDTKMVRVIVNIPGLKQQEYLMPKDDAQSYMKLTKSLSGGVARFTVEEV